MIGTSLLLLTIVLSAAAAGCATYLLNLSRDRTYHRADKMEQLYSLSAMLETAYGSFYEGAYSLAGEDYRMPDGNRHESRHLAEAGRSLVTIKMLVALYFPELIPPLERVLAAARTAHQLLARHEAAPVGERAAASERLDLSVAELKDAIADLRLAIADQAKALAPFQRIRRTRTPALSGGRAVRIAA